MSPASSKRPPRRMELVGTGGLIALHSADQRRCAFITESQRFGPILTGAEILDLPVAR